MASEMPCLSNNCSGHGRCTASGHCECDDEWEGLTCHRRVGTLPWHALALRILAGIVLVVALAMALLLAWCVRVQGLRPRDVLKGNYHVRKEEGWRREVVEGQNPKARFERFSEYAVGL